MAARIAASSHSSPRTESLVAAVVQSAERIMRKIDNVHGMATSDLSLGWVRNSRLFRARKDFNPAARYECVPTKYGAFMR